MSQNSKHHKLLFGDGSDLTVLKCYTVIMQFHWSGPLKMKVDQSWRYSDTYRSSLC